MVSNFLFRRVDPEILCSFLQPMNHFLPAGKAFYYLLNTKRGNVGNHGSSSGIPGIGGNP